MQTLISSLEIDQGTGVADNNMVDKADEYRMITAVERLEEAALECRDRALKDRDTVLIDGEIDAGELVFNERCEVLGKCRFVISENVDRESSGLLESVVAARHLLDADQNQGRFERDRAERGNRDAELLSRLVLRGNNGHAARESRQSGAEIGGRDGHRLNRESTLRIAKNQN